MVASTQQIATYPASLYSPSSTLLPEHIASFITAIALAARLSIRCSSLLIEALLESAKFSTSLSLGLSRQAIINALSTAKKLHELATTATDSTALTTTNNTHLDEERAGFLQVLDKYTNLGIYVVHHSFTLAELFALSGLQFASQSIKYGFMAAEESVSIIDGIFGSNESSRAIASIITLVHRELMSDPEFALTKIGKVAILSGLTKAMTAFAILQNVTHKRTMKHMNITVLWKGLVVEEENSQALIQFQQDNSDTSSLLSGSLSATNVSDGDSSTTHIIQELEEILASTESNNDSAVNESNTTSLISTSSSSMSNMNDNHNIDISIDKNGNPYNMYEITTITNRLTTKTTRIRPIDVHGNKHTLAKQVVERTDEDDKEAFVAVINPSDNRHADTTTTTTSTDRWDVGHQGHSKFKIMLSSVSKKLSRKKVERQTKYGIVASSDGETMNDTVDGPISTMTSTSATLRQQQSSTQYIASDSNQGALMIISDEEDASNDPSSFSEPEGKAKRRMSWSGLKIKSLSKKKSVSNLIQKGLDATNSSNKKKKSTTKSSFVPAVPPMPTAHSKSNHAKHNNDSHSNLPYIQSSNSISSLTSLSSIARTIKTTTYYTTPADGLPTNSSTSRSLIRSPSVPAKLHKKKTANASQLDTEPNPQNFPRKHIITNIAHFIRYASAAYGESFMRILGIGDIPTVLPDSHHPNHHAFAHHTGVSVGDILLSSYTDTHILSSVSHSKLHALVHYVTVDHFAEAIVLTCRGTLGLGDVLTDLTCDYKEFTLPTDKAAHGEEASGGHQRHYVAHGGMLEAAQLLATQKGKVFEAIKKGLEAYPNYGLVLCGHSLGAGVASLLSVLWSEEKLHFLSRRMMDSNQDPKVPHKFFDSFAAASIKRVSCPFVTSELSGLPAGRPIHCYTYGSPCVMSLPLSKYCGQGLVTSVVHAYDIVSGLSLGLLKDFKNVAVSLHEESHVTDEILSRIIGHYQNCKSSKSGKDTQDGNAHSEDEDEDQWFWALIKTMRADMRAEKLFPPSTMYLIESVPELVQHTESQSHSSNAEKVEARHRRAHMVKFSKCDDVQARFSEIVFSRTMFMDHSPNMYEKAIKHLNKGFFGQY